MAHFALICPPFFSHVKVFEALAQALAVHGHRSTFLMPAGGDRLLSPGAAVRTVSCPAFVAGDALTAVVHRAARATGPFGVLGIVADTAKLTDALCREGPAVLREIAVDGVIGDQMEPAAGLIAAHLGLPQVSVACALPINAAPGFPPPFVGWRYDPTPHGLKRNLGGEGVAQLFLTRQRRTIERWSKAFGLSPRSTIEACLSPILQLSQMPESLDFARPRDRKFHAVGPIRAPTRTGPSVLPFDVKSDKPFVFASFGTLQGHRRSLFATVAKACRRLDLQLLVAHCGQLSGTEAASLGATFVTDFVSQKAALARADICVTHGGMNTVLDSLEAGVPLVAIPIAFDQPGIGARIVHHKVGKRLSRVLLSSAAVEASLEALLDASSYRENAARIGRDISKAGGADLAARLIDETFGARRERVA